MRPPRPRLSRRIASPRSALPDRRSHVDRSVLFQSPWTSFPSHPLASPLPPEGSLSSVSFVLGPTALRLPSSRPAMRYRGGLANSRLDVELTARCRAARSIVAARCPSEPVVLRRLAHSLLRKTNPGFTARCRLSTTRSDGSLSRRATLPFRLRSPGSRARFLGRAPFTGLWLRSQLGHPDARGFPHAPPWSQGFPIRVGTRSGGDPGQLDRCLLPTIQFAKNGFPVVLVHSVPHSHAAGSHRCHADVLASVIQASASLEARVSSRSSPSRGHLTSL